MKFTQLGQIVRPMLVALLPMAIIFGVVAQTETADPAQIDGFRSAKFGMVEAEIMAAIASDLNIGASEIGDATHLVEQTRLLSVTVDDLLPQGGPSRITYILGYRTKKLIQVNLVWGGLAGFAT